MRPPFAVAPEALTMRSAGVFPVPCPAQGDGPRQHATAPESLPPESSLSQFLRFSFAANLDVIAGGLRRVEELGRSLT
jgi:hypothetical protein